VEAFDQPQARENEESMPRHDVTSARERTVESIGINQPYGVKMLSVVEKSATIMARITALAGEQADQSDREVGGIQQWTGSKVEQSRDQRTNLTPAVECSQISQ
jgi:hypothetical protein